MPMMKTLPLALALAMIVGGCSDPLAPDSVSPNLQVSSAEGVTLITQNRVPTVSMDALFEGDVIADEAGCIRLDGVDGATVIWALGSTLTSTTDGPVVQDASGETLGRLGEQFSLGGGEVPALTETMGFTALDQAFVEARCPGRYWMVSPS